MTADDALPLLYDELRKLAAARLAAENPGQTLQPTALVHEAYLRLVGGAPGRDWNDPAHFLAAVAETMRRILVDRARAKGRLKRGGARTRLDLRHEITAHELPSDDVLDLSEALNALAEEDPRKAELVKLRYFCGLSEEDAAGVLGLSRATAARHWAYARAWLHERLGADGENPRDP